jgi:hypothetical protein
VSVGSVEGEKDFVDGDTKAVGLPALLVDCRLRINATCAGEERKDEKAAQDPGLMYSAHVSEV